MSRPLTKPGAHGTLRLYAVGYADACERDNNGVQYVYAYDPDHAWEKVEDPEGGWTVTSVRRCDARTADRLI